MLNRYFFTLILFFCFVAAFAVQKKELKKGKHIYKVIKVDSSVVAIRNFNSAALKKYSSDDEFVYKQTSEGLSFIQRFILWFRQLFNNKAYQQTNYDFYEYLYIGLAAVVIVFIALRFNQINITGMFKREAKKTEIPYGESLENIHEISFDDEIMKAISARNYRLAVRLLYLRSLKQLNDAQLIHWQIEKTNTTYLTELTDTDIRQSFGLLTTQFEYVWYGDFAVNQDSFQQKLG
jgi:hypothetical protein